MTKELNSLPVQPPTEWFKPSYANTKGGKLYKPTHPDLFKVEFTPSEGGDEESFSSKAVALEVSPRKGIIKEKEKKSLMRTFL